MDTNVIKLGERNLKRWRQLQIPVAPYFELTPRCTLDCKMCYVHLTPEQMGERRELSTEQWLQIIDEAVEAGMLFVVLTGGECMLHPGFWQIYDRLLDKGVGVSVNTNAFTLTDADIERFRQRPPGGFRVTLYGASEEGYERCTGHRAFARVIANVVKLRDAGFHVVLAMTLSRYNAEEFVELARLARSLHLPNNYVLDLTEPNEDTGRRAEDFILTREETLELTRRLYEDEGKPIHKNEPIPELPPILPDDPNCRGMRCGAGRTSYVIHWDGRMSPCLEYRSELKIQDVGFQAAWEACKELAKVYPQPVECETCKLLPVCRMCVMARQDPKNPGHCDPERCRKTIDHYNAGFTTLKPDGPREESIFDQSNENC